MLRVQLPRHPWPSAQPSAAWPQVAYLFRHTILKGLEPAGDAAHAPTMEFRLVVFRCLDALCVDGQLLMDLFVNFDCDPDRSDTVLLERMFKALAACVSHPDALTEPAAQGAMPLAQRSVLRYAALKCLGQAMRALFEWHERVSGARRCFCAFVRACACCVARSLEHANSCDQRWLCLPAW